MQVSSKGQIPWNKGLTKETSGSLRKASESHKGQVPWNRGMPAWNKGLTKETDERIKNSARKSSESHKGQPCWNKGLTREIDKRLRVQSEKLKRYYKKRPGTMKGKTAWNKGKRGKEATRWIDGRSYLPYPAEFTGKLKELVRQRDNYQCQKCGCPERENIWKLAVHHIDYDKKNCSSSNLFSLCCRCNSLVNEDREYWEQYFKEKMESLYGKEGGEKYV